jgi:hypothetical protein
VKNGSWKERKSKSVENKTEKWGGDLKRKMMMIEHGRERIGERGRDLGMEGPRGGPGQVRIVMEKEEWND